MSASEQARSHPQEGSVDGDTSKPEVIDLESWLPVTGSREGKWWYATFHNVTAMVGAGVLGLPFAMSQLGWFPGISTIVFSWLVTLYTLWQLVELHELVPGKRFDRYHQLGQHAFGNTLGYWIVAPQQAMVQASCDIVYMVTGGKSLHKSLELAMSDSMSLTQSHCILIFAAIQLILSQLPNFNSLSCVSFLAAFMSFCYSFISFAASIFKGSHNHAEYGPRSSSETEQAFGVLNALGTIAFAYAGHSVVLEIQATIPSSPEKPSTKPMWQGVVGAYIIVILCYLSVSVAGYWAFGNLVQDDVLISLSQPNWLIGAANAMVFLHVVGSYQVFAMPIFDLIESGLVRRLNMTPGRILRVWSRSAYVCFTCVVGICVPFFGGLLGFFGGLLFTPTTYYLPCIMWLTLKKPKRFTFHWCACWVGIVSGFSLMILAPIGGLKQIIHDAKGYKFFS